ncbi:tetratricopeptide repeat protein [Usitatibacter palustris]|nr:tetratricopeptide repeat protein [Usitatibacter palustris]
MLRLLAAIALAAMPFHGAAQPKAAAPAAAEIASLDGKGEFREVSQLAWKPAAVKQSLFATNYVRTGDGSRMGILFPDRTQLRLAPNSTLQIKETAGTKDAATTINLNSGRSWVQSKTAPKGLIMETPSALAAIRGTDWEMAVDAEGRATLSVFSGEVEFYNEHGRVLVARNEQALAEKGKAPVKLLLNTSRKRIQWVSSITVDPNRYTGPGSPLLVKADEHLFNGDTASARKVLEDGARQYPDDARFPAALSRLASFEDEPERAIAIAREAVAKGPNSVEALLALGDAERLEGQARAAGSAYARAIEVAANDARGYQGAGIIEGERENVGRARVLFEKALALDPSSPSHLAELGTLESFAGNFARAKELLQKAVAEKPDHYVAWTGLGVLGLKTGDIPAAHEALLKATLVEPRYARAHLYIAATWYAQERVDAALEALRRAAELDPRDPMPYLLASIIHVDRIEYALAAEQAREALVRMPNLKSANQIADNQKGIANVGTALASLGLESWSRSLAQDSYMPFWGGSHLFLADRYPGEFNKRSELIQGFVTDPLVFGASNRFQTLFAAPGHHATASIRYGHSDDFSVIEPVITLNGYIASPRPMSYFIEGIETRVDSGNAIFDGSARTITAAFGFRPTHELSAFLYFNRLSADVDLGSISNFGTAGVTRENQTIVGDISRLDAGLRYAPTADTSWWLKAGGSREDSKLDTVLSLELFNVATLKQDQHFQQEPTTSDVALRTTTVAWKGWELTAGAETSRKKDPRHLVRDEGLHLPANPVNQEALDQEDRDRTDIVYAHARWKGERATAEVGLAWREHTKDRDILATLPGGIITATENYNRRGWDPALGGTYRTGEASLLRAACRQWLRPIGLDTLMPIAIAGIPLDDQLVLGGGELKQCNAAWQWNVRRDLFVVADVGESRVENLVSPLDGPLNTSGDTTNLDRLRNRVITPPATPDRLEQIPIYSEGRVRKAHVGLESIVSPAFAVRAHYTFSDSKNTNSLPLFSGKEIPYVPRHYVNLGFTWTIAPRVFVTTIASNRSKRYADEANLVVLPHGWDAQVTLFTESADKRWALEVFGGNLFRKEDSDVFSAVVSYRF